MHNYGSSLHDRYHHLVNATELYVYFSRLFLVFIL